MQLKVKESFLPHLYVWLSMHLVSNDDINRNLYLFTWKSFLIYSHKILKSYTTEVSFIVLSYKCRFIEVIICYSLFNN